MLTYYIYSQRRWEKVLGVISRLICVPCILLDFIIILITCSKIIQRALMLVNNYKAAWQLYNFLVMKNKNNESSRKTEQKGIWKYSLSDKTWALCGFIHIQIHHTYWFPVAFGKCGYSELNIPWWIYNQLNDIK